MNAPHDAHATDLHDDHHHAQPQLLHDLRTLAEHGGRRQLLRWLGAMGAAGALPLAGCGGGGDTDSGNSSSSSSSGTTTTTTTTTANGSCTVVPEETQGPYPGDGSNTANGSIANALTLSGIVRSNITSSVGGTATGTAAGVPLTLTITLTNTNNSCAALDGYAIYLWHCTRDGKYSMYASGVTGENYLRGVQATDSNGQVTFQTIFPGCYSGRMPHMHFEVYRDANTATSYTNKLKTSQLAFPVATCQTIYNNASGYSASIGNLAAISFATDGIFSDGVDQQLVAISGNVTDGYEASITVSISV